MKIRLDKMPYSAWMVTRFWHGKLIHIWFWRYLLVVDIRKDWVSDMTNGRMSKNDLSGDK